jgi:hypothetical protein
LQWNTHNQTNPNDEHVCAPQNEYDDALTSECHQQQPLTQVSSDFDDDLIRCCLFSVIVIFFA